MEHFGQNYSSYLLEPLDIKVVDEKNNEVKIQDKIEKELKDNIKISDDPELYEVLWSDGILFTTKQIMHEFNGFNEDYFGDCEMQDLGYRLHFAGYTNIYWKNLFKHKLIDYTIKSNQPDELIRLAWMSRQLFKDTWNELEYSIYNFKSNPS